MQLFPDSAKKLGEFNKKIIKKKEKEAERSYITGNEWEMIRMKTDLYLSFGNVSPVI